MMLAHIGQADVAARVRNAWLATIEDGVHTADIWHHRTSAARVGTREFARAVIERLGCAPGKLPAADCAGDGAPIVVPPYRRADVRKELVGVDVFVECATPEPAALAARVEALGGTAFRLTMISNRGVKVWPDGQRGTFCTDHWRCRFQARRPDGQVRHEDVVALLARLSFAGIDFVKTEHLCTFDGVPGFSVGQGQ
jgi:isocitrate dehydrogenase